MARKRKSSPRYQSAHANAESKELDSLPVSEVLSSCDDSPLSRPQHSIVLKAIRDSVERDKFWTDKARTQLHSYLTKVIDRLDSKATGPVLSVRRGRSPRPSDVEQWMDAVRPFISDAPELAEFKTPAALARATAKAFPRADTKHIEYVEAKGRPRGTRVRK